MHFYTWDDMTLLRDRKGSSSIRLRMPRFQPRHAAFGGTCVHQLELLNPDGSPTPRVAASLYSSIVLILPVAAGRFLKRRSAAILAFLIRLPIRLGLGLSAHLPGADGITLTHGIGRCKRVESPRHWISWGRAQAIRTYLKPSLFTRYKNIQQGKLTR